MEIRISNSLEEMPTIVSMVEDLGRRHKVPCSVINELNLVLDEVISNIVSYGYPDGGVGWIVVHLDIRPGQVVTEIRDNGIAFDPLSVAAPDLTGTVETRRIGGVGIHFMNSLMDSVAYARVRGENRLTLRKNFSIQAPID